MPLKKGSSQKTISTNVGELVGSFCEPVLNVLHMFKRMAIWAKNLKIAHVIVVAISILVVNAQNFWVRIISASFARIDQPSRKHIFTNGLKSRNPNIFLWFVYTSYAAINSLFRWASKKSLSTIFAFARNRSFNSLRFVVTFFTTIFCFVGSGRYVRKFITACFAICGNLNSRCKSLAGSGTVLEAIKSVSWYVNKRLAMPARCLLPSVES